MYERRTLVWDGGEVAEYADLSGLASGPINDMIVDADGRVYVSQLGFDYLNREDPRDSPMMVIEPDGTTHAATEEVMDAEKSKTEDKGSIWTARVPVSGGLARP
jgi:hypothetical protein